MKISDAEIASLLFAEQGSNPTTPASGFGRIYVKSDGVYFRDDAGTVTGPFTAGAGSFVGAKAYRATSAQTITTATWTPVQFNAEDFDTNTYHDNSTNPSRFTVPSGKGGYYRAVFQTSWDTNTTGLRYMDFYKNGASVSRAFSAVPAANAVRRRQISDVIALTVGDYLEGSVYQDSGANRTLDFDGLTFMAIEYLGA